MADTFDGFPAEGLAFLTELGRQNKAWFDKNRKTYNELVVTPTKAFVTAMGEQLVNDISPAIVAQPKTNGSIAPINNDLRFSPDKSPYKDHLMLRFWEGENKKTAPTLMIRIGEDDVGFASNVVLPKLDRWRTAVAEESGEALATAIGDLGRGRKLDVAGEGYKKVPKPFDPDHPRASLLRHKGGFQVRWLEPAPKAMHGPRFVDWCGKRLEKCAPVHRWLVDNL